MEKLRLAIHFEQYTTICFANWNKLSYIVSHLLHIKRARTITSSSSKNVWNYKHTKKERGREKKGKQKSWMDSKKVSSRANVLKGLIGFFYDYWFWMNKRVKLPSAGKKIWSKIFLYKICFDYSHYVALFTYKPYYL